MTGVAALQFSFALIIQFRSKSARKTVTTSRPSLSESRDNQDENALLLLLG